MVAKAIIFMLSQKIKIVLSINWNRIYFQKAQYLPTAELSSDLYKAEKRQWTHSKVVLDEIPDRYPVSIYAYFPSLPFRTEWKKSEEIRDWVFTSVVKWEARDSWPQIDFTNNFQGKNPFIKYEQYISGKKNSTSMVTLSKQTGKSSNYLKSKHVHISIYIYSCAVRFTASVTKYTLFESLKIVNNQSPPV